uniref:Uncharacterized protein n=1 Tax=Steinernema glaseri TaxID=37863 RepID=A0A1I7ZL44_9BILA
MPLFNSSSVNVRSPSTTDFAVVLSGICPAQVQAVSSLIKCLQDAFRSFCTLEITNGDTDGLDTIDAGPGVAHPSPGSYPGLLGAKEAFFPPELPAGISELTNAKEEVSGDSNPKSLPQRNLRQVRVPNFGPISQTRSCSIEESGPDPRFVSDEVKG